MFFLFSDRNRQDLPLPNRVYARVDKVESQGDDEGGTVAFDCIDADWVDERWLETRPDHIAPLTREEDPEVDRRISIIEAPAEAIWDVMSFEMEPELNWWELAFSELPADGVSVEQYPNLFAAPVERGLKGWKRLSDRRLPMMNVLAGWEGIAPSEDAEIEEAIERRIDDQDHSVAVFDVGQGSSAALVAGGACRVYFDLGGGAIGNTRTFPKSLRNFAFAGEDLIVLSHWDWDHWSSAFRDPEALLQTWILPIQSGAGSLGAVHARFIARLTQSGARLIWMGPGSYTGSILLGGNQETLAVYRADGPVSSRNETGIVVQIGTDPARIVFPGDASLQHCHRLGAKVDCLVVPHHGGKSSLANLPAPRRKTRSHLVYSYGGGNSYLHPLKGTVLALRSTWKKNAHTAIRGPLGVGHIGIYADDDLARQQMAKLFVRMAVEERDPVEFLILYFAYRTYLDTFDDPVFVWI